MTARAYKEYMDYCEITQGYYNTGKEDGYKQGVEDGEERAKLDAARNLINLGVSLDIIAQAQGLSLETVQQLAEELKIKAQFFSQQPILQTEIVRRKVPLLLRQNRQLSFRNSPIYE